MHIHAHHDKHTQHTCIYTQLNSRNEDDEEGGGGDASSVGSPSPTEAKKKDKDKDKDKKDKEKVGFLKKRFGSKKKKAIEKPTPPSPSKALDGVYGIVTSPRLSSQSKIDFGWPNSRDDEDDEL